MPPVYLATTSAGALRYPTIASTCEPITTTRPSSCPRRPPGRRARPDQRHGLVRAPRRTGDVADRHPLAGHRSSSTREVTLAADAGRDPPRDGTKEGRPHRDAVVLLVHPRD